MKAFISLVCGLVVSAWIGSSSASVSDAGVNSKSDLEWGVVLFGYFQQDYFNALVEYDYAFEIENEIAASIDGRLLQGGMLLSYGLPSESKKIFDLLLDANTTIEAKNRAWFYLAKLYYHKSDTRSAYEALQRIKGKVSDDLHPEYHYLATLIHNSAKHLKANEKVIQSLPKGSPHYPYLVFNLAIGQLNSGNLEGAVDNLERVTLFAEFSEDLATLADRARHGLSQLALRNNQIDAAWTYLKAIRTTGIYSNRALLTYAWTAIKIKQFNEAIPALRILEERDIAIPEVQEARVLLAHLYEQEGSPRKALKSNLLAIKAFDAGIKRIEEARSIIAKQDVPREYIMNLKAIKEDSDWYGTKPSVNYHKLTPFLIDLLSSNAFNETLQELSDLYALQENLEYWLFQAKEHKTIYDEAKKKSFSQDRKKVIKESERLKAEFLEQQSELKLLRLTLNLDQQKRLDALVETTNREIGLLESRINQIKTIKGAYKQPLNYKKVIQMRHKEIEINLNEAVELISLLEPVMRNLVNAELTKHEERMRYYWAQSRLAKARLYDTMLMDLENVKPVKKEIEVIEEESR